MHISPYIDPSKCTGCQKCISLCPMNAIYIYKGHANIDTKLCRNCHLCLRVCPHSAIKNSNQ